MKGNFKGYLNIFYEKHNEKTYAYCKLSYIAYLCRNLRKRKNIDLKVLLKNSKLSIINGGYKMINEVTHKFCIEFLKDLGSLNILNKNHNEETYSECKLK